MEWNTLLFIGYEPVNAENINSVHFTKCFLVVNFKDYGTF